MALRLLLLALLPLAACGGPREPGPRPVVGVALVDLTNDFFRELERSMRAEAEKRDLRLLVRSAEGDPARQAAQIRELVGAGVAALVVSPCDAGQAKEPLFEAASAAIPVFTVDIDAGDFPVVCHVASDNVAGGRKAGAKMAEMLHGLGTVVILDHQTASSVRDRTAGFWEAIVKHPRIKLLPSIPTEGDRARARQVMQQLLPGHPELVGVFAINDRVALGALRAIEAAGRNEIVLIGYDATPEARVAIGRKSALRASVAQDPERMGAASMQVVARHLAGEAVPRSITVDVNLVD